MAIVSSAADIGSEIAKARKDQSLSQAELAKRAQTTQSMVSQIERGKNTAHVGIVLRLAAALGLIIDVLPPSMATARDASRLARPPSIVFEDPLPDDSIDLDVIAGDKPKA